MALSSRKLIAMLELDGFSLRSIKGSHHKFVKNNRTVIVPHPKKDLPQGTIRSIVRQAGWTMKDIH